MKPESVGSESFYLPFEHGFDTMVAVMAYYKAHIGSVRPFKQQGIVMAIQHEKLLKRLWWFHNRFLDFQAGIEILGSKTEMDEYLADSKLVICSADLYEACTQDELSQLYHFNGPQGTRTLLIRDMGTKGISFELVD